MTSVIQREKSEYLYQQVIRMIQGMRQSGSLLPGDRLPSLRALSKSLGVSIPTVKQAYEELERQHLVEARPKSGYFLSAIRSIPQTKRVKLAQQPKMVKRQSLIEQVFAGIHTPGVAPFGIANPASALPSDKTLAKFMRRVLARASVQATQYGPIEGFLPLKRQLALRYLDFGLEAAPDEILITNGAQEALAIALQCVAKPGDVIAVESPAYFGFLELIENLGMRALEIPLCPEEGVWLDDLENAIANHPVKACVFSSSISNPLGSIMTNARRQAIVALLESKNIPLVEDDVYGDLYFEGERGVPAQYYSRKGLVLTCASFSKTAAPGYRIGWLMAGRFQARAIRLKRALSCSSSLLNQWTLSDFIRSGDYDRNMRKLRAVLRCNKDRMVALIDEHFPSGTRLNNPKGGGVLWLELPRGNDSAVFFNAALEKKISITPGALFSAGDKYRRCIRLSYGLPWDESIATSVKQLADLVN